MGWTEHQCIWDCVKHKNVEYNSCEEYLIKRFTLPTSRNDNGELSLDYFLSKTILHVWTFEEEQCLVYSLQFYQRQWNWWNFVCYLKCCWFNTRSSLDIRMALQNLFQNSDMNAIIKPFGKCLLTDFKDNIFDFQVNNNIFWNETNATVIIFFLFYWVFALLFFFWIFLFL